MCYKQTSTRPDFSISITINYGNSMDKFDFKFKLTRIGVLYVYQTIFDFL